MASYVSLFPEEAFPHLSKAPITEAIFQLQARASDAWNEENVASKLKGLLPDYPKADSRKIFGHRIMLQQEAPTIQKMEEKGWGGILFKSENELHVANFEREAFSFSRLAPYQDWPSFLGEALRLAQLHVSLAQPVEFRRLGLRFINQIDVVPELNELSDYFNQAPQPPKIGLPFDLGGFFHNETYALANGQYAVTITKTLQPPIAPGAFNQPAKIILDLDVFTTVSMEPDLLELEVRLRDMRWIKNKVFFANLSPHILDHLK